MFTLNQQISILRNDLNNLKINSGDFSGGIIEYTIDTISSLDEKVDSLNIDFISLSGSVDNIITNATSLSGSVDTIINNATSLSGSVDTIINNATSLSGSVDNIITNVYSLSGSVDNIITDINSLSGSVDSIITDINNVDASLNMKQNILTAGTNITISGDTISAGTISAGSSSSIDPTTDLSCNSLTIMSENPAIFISEKESQLLFDTIVIRRPTGVTGVTNSWNISLYELQVWVNSQNILPSFAKKAYFTLWNGNRYTDIGPGTAATIASRIYNNVISDSGRAYSTDDSNVALVIRTLYLFNPNDIQALVLYARNVGGHQDYAKGLAIELYNSVNDHNLTTPVVSTRIIIASYTASVFRFPKWSTYTLATSNNVFSKSLIMSGAIVGYQDFLSIPDSFIYKSRNFLYTGLTGATVNTSAKIFNKFITNNVVGWVPIDNNLNTGFIASFVPKSSNSKILINCTLHVSCKASTDSRWWAAKLYRKIGLSNWEEVVGATNNGQLSKPTGTGCFMVSHHQSNNDTFIQNLSNSYLDTASDNINIHYYTIYWRCQLAGNRTNRTITLNRAITSDTTYRALPVSSIVMQEIYYP